MEYRYLSAMLTWMKVKFGGETWIFVRAYRMRSERSEEEREAFWSELARCVEERKRGCCLWRRVLMGCCFRRSVLGKDLLCF